MAKKDVISGSTADGQPDNKTKTVRKRRKSGVKTHIEESNGRPLIQSLPPEIMGMILDSITDVKDMNCISQSCKILHQEIMPRIYRRIAVAAPYHSHIVKLIRAAEPHLSIKQKMMLKEIGEYRGQQESYPIDQDETLIPSCAAFVTQLVIGVIDPGKNHVGAITLYLEELVKNLTNLEVLETVVVTNSICKSLVDRTHLKSLSLSVNELINYYHIQPLTDLKGLENLRLHGENWSRNHDSHIARILLKNCMTTLRSIEIQTKTLMFDEKLLVLLHEDSKSGFQNLELLDIECKRLPRNGIDLFHKIIDISTLRNLSISGLGQELIPFINSCTKIFTSAKSVSLSGLSIDMDTDTGKRKIHEREKPFVDTVMNLLLSFSHLRSLELKNLGRTFQDMSRLFRMGLEHLEANYSELLPSILRAIFTHANLVTLKFSYSNARSGPTCPSLSGEMVGQIIRHLPLLEEFTFPPMVGEVEEISEALSLAANLQHVTCFPYLIGLFTRFTDEGSDEELVGIIAAEFAARVPEELCRNMYVKTKLKRKRDASSLEAPVIWWNRHYKLKTICTNSKTWEISPKPFKGNEKGKRKSNMQMVEENSMCFWYRDISPRSDVNFGYDAQFSWIEGLNRRY